jgi:hypothetical protein
MQKKVKFDVLPQGYIRRMVVRDTSFPTFLEKLKEMKIDVKQYEMSYRDDEGDNVSFSTQNEWEVFLKQSETEIARFQMIRKDFIGSRKKRARGPPTQMLVMVLLCILFTVITNIFLSFKLGRINNACTE